jgi:hypothetical protein
MSFYDPENFTSLDAIDAAQSQRLLQPIWSFIKDGREDMLRSALFPPLFALGIDYTFVAIFLGLCCINHYM